MGELVARGLAEAGVDVRTGVSVTGLSRPGGALTSNGMVVDLDRGYLLGVTFVGPGVAVAGQIPRRPAMARRPLLPFNQRGLVAPAGGVPRLGAVPGPCCGRPARHAGL